MDESYDQDHFFMAAALGSEEVWDKVELALQAIRDRTAREHQSALDVEFHGHQLMQGQAPWECMKGKHREAAAIYTAVTRAAREAGVTFIVRGVHVGRLNGRYKYPKPPASVVLGHLLERIDDYAKATEQSDEVIVVADEVHTQDEHRAEFSAWQLTGTSGYRTSRLGRISSPINFASSRLVDGLQVADLCAYLKRRRNCGRERSRRSQAASDRMWAPIQQSLWHDGTWMP